MCSESRFCCVKACENCLLPVCEESVCEMAGFEAVLSGIECEVWRYVLQNQLLLYFEWVGVDSSIIGLHDVCSVGGLLGFRMGKIFARFHDVQILCVSRKLNMSVSALLACVPQCFRCKFEISSGLVADLFFLSSRWPH